MMTFSRSDIRTESKAPDIFATKHNLLDTANIIDLNVENWRDRLDFVPEGCAYTNVQEADCPPALKQDFTEDLPDWITFKPYVLELAIDLPSNCDPDYLKRALEIQTSAALERAIAEGTVPAGDNPSFADTALGTGATDVLAAIGLVEAKLMEAGQQGGTIHISAYDAALASKLFTEHDGKLYTKTTGNPVIIGNYPKGEVFIHGGEVDVYLDEIFTVHSFGTLKKNRLLYVTERLALVVWNNCHTVREGTGLTETGYEEDHTAPTPTDTTDAGGLAPVVTVVPGSGPLPGIDCSNAPTDANTKVEIIDWLNNTGVTFDEEPTMALTKPELLDLVASLCN